MNESKQIVYRVVYEVIVLKCTEWLKLQHYHSMFSFKRIHNVFQNALENT